MVEVGRSGMLAVSLGLVAGLGAAFVALRTMKNQLFGVHSLDPLTLLVACGLDFAACVAGFGPTLRIASINPASTLRSE